MQETEAGTNEDDKGKVSIGDVTQQKFDFFPFRLRQATPVL
jgi:hypothetical protein